MTDGFRVSSKLTLPKESALWTFGYLAIRGAGKTYDACVVAEEFMKANIPIVALDPLGIWWGLRVGTDGNQGLPVVIFGGPHKDISIPSTISKGHELVDETRLKDLVKAMLQSHISVVLDTSEYSKSQQRRIVGIFTEELVRLNAPYGIRHVFIEEADTVVPQRSSGDTAFVAGAVNDLVRRGGNFNLGASLISQRAAVVNKDVLTQINCLVALQILHKLDKKAVQTWVEEVVHPNDPKLAKFADSLKNLSKGEAWVWHTGEPEIFKRVQFRERETLHATREYFLQSKFDQENIKSLDVGEFISKFKDKYEPKKELPKVQQPKPEVQRVAIQQGGIAQSGSATALQSRLESQSNYQTANPEILGSNPTASSTILAKEVNQALPNLEIHQYKPTLKLDLPESLNEPSSILGKVAVVLKTTQAPSNNNAKWSVKAIRERIEAHAWDSAGLEDALDQLKHWEIITLTANGMLRFDPSRVQVVDRGATLPVS